MHDKAIQELLDAEQRRCAAISNDDLAALDGLLAEEISHTHITGKTQNRDEYLEGLKGRPRLTWRGDDLNVRLFGDVAVMTGTIHNTFPPENPGDEPRSVALHALQVWVRDTPDTWRQAAFASSGQSTRQRS